MPELEIGKLIKFKRSNGIIQSANVCRFNSEFVGVTWFEDGKQFGKLVAISEIIETPKKLRLGLLGFVIIFFSILFFLSLVVFFFGVAHIFNNSFQVYTICLETRQSKINFLNWMGDCEKNISIWQVSE